MMSSAPSPSVMPSPSPPPSPARMASPSPAEMLSPSAGAGSSYSLPTTLYPELPFPLKPAPAGLPLPPARFQALDLIPGEPISPDFVLPWVDENTPEPYRSHFDQLRPHPRSTYFKNLLINPPPLRRPPPEFEGVPLPLGGGAFIVWGLSEQSKAGMSSPFVRWDTPASPPRDVQEPLLHLPKPTKLSPNWRLRRDRIRKRQREALALKLSKLKNS